MIRRLLRVPARLILIALAAFATAAAMGALSGAGQKQIAEKRGNEVPAGDLGVVKYDVIRTGWTYELKGHLPAGIVSVP